MKAKAFRSKRLGALLVVVVMVASLGVAAASGQKPTFESSAIVELAGVDSVANNILTYSDTVVVAPCFPSGGLSENPATGPEDGAAEDELAGLDNHFLKIISKNDPTATKSIDLTCYYPTRIVRDESGRKIFVRATDFIKTPNGLQPGEVVACIDLGNKDDAVPTVVKVPVKAASNDPTDLRIPWTDFRWASNAPSAFVSGRGGRVGVHTNGKEVFSVSLIDGSVNTVDLVADADFPEKRAISDLQFDAATNTLVVVVTGSFKPKKGALRYISDLYFFRLGEDGQMDPLGAVKQEDLLDGASLTPLSDVVVLAKPDGTADSATFVTDDGSVLRVTIESHPTVKRLGAFPELAKFDGPTNGEVRGATSVSIAPDGKWLVAGVKGVTLAIRRPSWVQGPGGHIRRPSWIATIAEAPKLAVASFGKSGKLTGGAVYTDFGRTENSISNPVIDGSSRVLFMTSSGRLLSAAPGEQGLSQLGEIESGMDSFSYSPSEKSVVGVRSVTLDQDWKVGSKGAIVLARLDFGENTTAILSTDRLSMRIFGLIRRPCGIGMFGK
ncbi:MAG TPA: hypothetical protein VFV34_19890 [Blastocatellia bacterium]|nr:hypothetical protein [Blastocatellia bacterium]